ncbi:MULTISPECIES: VCBS repeat-containing protein [unclassified Colwellia]|uniref:FG-GAP repeat domain-containing protein n=1 Tax=unclassified Colwellia TaxID=196834 RepID=UPI0015F71C8E|nr:MULTISPECIES: VCBS repeat-containing protein [unclassified Colwellia]MBA6358042.1 VCBS repeat-containing protein [Colwellia sp. BRX8-3]MBA6361820.1 VCBS repeat-containing protein [Colwellia sp. BRX8-6]MBA6367817.1 VCBS repeat-containing protein [Colwellia sp. BRX8-5]MBA6374608.1 VCBS repeat-containing protein [Colwellia sp. BRX8-2]
MSKIATITMVLLLTTLASPLLLAKANKLNFNKSQQSSQHKITGKLLYLNEKDGDVDLLIHDDNRFSYYPRISESGLVEQAQIIDIPENAQFFNQATLAKQVGEVIVYLTTNAVMSYNLEDKTISKLIDVDTLYKYQGIFDVNFGDFVHDFNQDGLSDFITHSLDTTHIYLQNATGAFTQQSFAISPRIEKSGRGLSFTPQNFYHADFNHDDKKDIAFQIDDQLMVFAQTPAQLFDHNPMVINLNAHLENKNSTIKKQQGEKSASVKLETIEDINGDGLVDIVTKESVREGMMSRTNHLMIRYGFIENGLMQYKKEADGHATFDGEGMIKFKDVDGDGLKDYYTLSVEMGIGTMMSAMSGAIDMDLRFYKLEKNGKYVKKPVYENEVEIAINSGSDGEALTDVSDFNGDGINDLILKTDDKEFTIYSGAKGKRLFAKRGADYEISLPKSVRTEIKDFNNDGKADILFLYGTHYDEDEEKEVGENKLTLWLSAS